LSNADGLTPVIDVSIPMGTGVYAELTTYNQMSGVLEPTSYMQIVPAVTIKFGFGSINLPAQYGYKNSDVHIDATRIRGQLTLAAGTVHPVAAPPAVYGKTVSSVYSVSVQHSWKSLGVLVNAANDVAAGGKTLVYNVITKPAAQVKSVVCGWLGC